ncbi:MAG: hypothetical protein K8S27_15705, partial [Candidatus Omnitrophica bacterium]|nr:hypothetical protein [Candidatus Omnitrophota bacterium]
SQRHEIPHNSAVKSFMENLNQRISNDLNFALQYFINYIFLQPWQSLAAPTNTRGRPLYTLLPTYESVIFNPIVVSGV